MDEIEAVSRIKQGDLSGLEELVNRYQVKAVHSAWLILQDRALAEEVAQDAFLKVCVKIDQYDTARPFAPWFFRIVVNDAIKVIRQHKRLQTLTEEPDGEAWSLAEVLVDPAPLPEKQIEHLEDLERLRAAMNLLSPGQRAVVTMRYYLQIPEKEMSLRLDQPLSTIKWWLRAARKRLRRSLQAVEIENKVPGGKK
jgi:RNA polymerase sigma-70 factor (ECF subfamily)